MSDRTEDLLAMTVGETAPLTTGTMLRVPGGWVYESITAETHDITCCFVPEPSLEDRDDDLVEEEVTATLAYWQRGKNIEAALTELDKGRVARARDILHEALGDLVV